MAAKEQEPVPPITGVAAATRLHTGWQLLLTTLRDAQRVGG